MDRGILVLNLIKTNLLTVIVQAVGLMAGWVPAVSGGKYAIILFVVVDSQYWLKQVVNL